MHKGREAPESLAFSIKMALLKLQLMSEKMARHALLTCLLSSCAVYASAVLAFRNWQVSINPPLGAVYRLDIMTGMPEVIKNTAVSNFQYFLSSPVRSDTFDSTTDEGQNVPH